MVKVRFKGINTYVSKGKRRYYHRATGIRLPDDPETREFADAYYRAENGLRRRRTLSLYQQLICITDAKMCRFRPVLERFCITIWRISDDR